MLLILRIWPLEVTAKHWAKYLKDSGKIVIRALQWSRNGRASENLTGREATMLWSFKVRWNVRDHPTAWNGGINFHKALKRRESFFELQNAKQMVMSTEWWYFCQRNQIGWEETKPHDCGEKEVVWCSWRVELLDGDASFTDQKLDLISWHIQIN